MLPKDPTGSKSTKIATRDSRPAADGKKSKVQKKSDLRVAAPGPEVNLEIVEDAHKYLSAFPETPKAAQSDDGIMAEWFASRIVTFNKNNRRQHYETIAAAYAAYAASIYDESMQKAVSIAAVERGVVVSTRKSRLRLIVELHVSYGEGDDAASKRLAEKNYSRDVVAITNLIKRGVPPSKVLELSDSEGEGLDKWVRWRPAINEEIVASADVSAGKTQDNHSKDEPIGNENKSPIVSHAELDNAAETRKPSLLDFGECPNEIVWFKKVNGRPIPMMSVALAAKMNDIIEALLSDLDNAGRC